LWWVGLAQTYRTILGDQSPNEPNPRGGPENAWGHKSRAANIYGGIFWEIFFKPYVSVGFKV
jgi:hypothetical protein